MLFRLARVMIWLSSVLLMLALHTAKALEPATPLERLARQAWTVENGLPQNTVPAILQSRQGYLWVGTELGLARFDGSNFLIIDHARFSSFPDAEVRCLLDASIGESGEDLWVGTSDGLVHWRNGKPTLFTTQEGLQSNSIRGLLRSSDGVIWAWTNAGLSRWTNGRFQNFRVDGLANGSISSMAAGQDGEVWVGATNGLFLLKGNSWQGDSAISKGETGAALVSAVHSSEGSGVLVATAEGVFLHSQGSVAMVLDKAELPKDSIDVLALLPDGTVAAGSKSTLVLIHRQATTRRKDSANLSNFKTVERFSVGKELPGSRINIVYADREGCLWVGTNRGLGRIPPNKAIGVDQTNSTTVELLHPTDALAVDSVIAILEDREGDLWIGTETAGLHLMKDARARMFGAADGLSSDATTAIVQDHKGSLWVGTRESGLNRIAPPKLVPSQTTHPVQANFTTADGLLSNVVLSLAVAPNGDVWVGTPDGLNRISGGSQKVDSYTSADGLPDDFIRSLLAEADNSLWVGTRRGLTHLVRGTYQTLTTKDGLGSDLVGAMVRTGDGDHWIATLHGLSRLRKGHIVNYTTADGLTSNIVTALDVDKGGRLWIGTQGGGLEVWDGQRILPVGLEDLHQAKTQPGTASGQDSLPRSIHAVQHDDRGHLWLASGSGLTRADSAALLNCARSNRCQRTTAQVVEFSTADGLRSRETSSNSHPTACLLADGELWFTTPRGVAIVDPDHFAEPLGPPPLVIERFAVDDQTSEQIQNEPIRVAAGHLSFQFDYAGLSFASPQKLRYQYKLEGFDPIWTDAGARKTAYYTNIPPGQYRFVVRTAFSQAALPSLSSAASDKDASAAYSETSFGFVLLPHFYQTVWFRSLALFLVSMMIVLIFKTRVLRVEREFRAVMAERNRIAREIHDTLAQGYVGISLQLEVVGELLRHNRTEAATNHLVLTQSLVREGLDDARQSIWALRSQDAREITLPVRLQRLVEKAQTSELTTMLEVHGAYRPGGAAVEKELLRIAQEAIQNVIRHARASNLVVRLAYGQRTLELTVSDNGRGFTVRRDPLGASGKQNQPDKLAQSAHESNDHHFGLTGMQERAALISAQLEVFSQPGQGTTITVTVPVPDASFEDEHGWASESGSALGSKSDEEVNNSKENS